MSNTYQLTFELKQHTPIIHFQHDQAGATLRATEVKPKLDRFILTKFGDGIYEDGVKMAKNDNLLVGKGEHPALDFKIRVKDVTNLEKQVINGYPCYFANMGDGANKNLMMANKLNIDVFSFHSSLIEKIDKHFESFLLETNFGSRQSKGFGSFTLMKDQKLNILDCFDYHFKLKVDEKTHSQNDSILLKGGGSLSDEEKQIMRLFGQIDIFYKSLRSGINRKGREGVAKFYIKPAIFHYAKDVLRVQWDKKSIKECYLEDDLEKQIEEHNHPDILTYSSQKNHHHLLLKDMFGLSSDENWRWYQANLKKSHSSIERFKSPITFKPIRTGNSEFFVGIKTSIIPNDYLDEVFNIEFGRIKNLTLKTPKSFDWRDFFDYVIKRMPLLDERCSPNGSFKTQPEYRVLSYIYPQLKSTN